MVDSRCRLAFDNFLLYRFLCVQGRQRFAKPGKESTVPLVVCVVFSRQVCLNFVIVDSLTCERS